MASLDNSLRQKLERLFNMRTGYVMDFSNGSFADFVATSIGIDPYEKYSGSKAWILRQIWTEEPLALVRKLNLELLDHWRTNKLLSDQEATRNEEMLYNECIESLNNLTIPSPESSADLAFLEKEFGDIDLTALQVPISSREVIDQRLKEIDSCLTAEAPLAAIFLCGSTLEGLLFEVAEANEAAFLASPAAPTRRSVVKPLGEWSLANLIAVAREQSVVGEDVSKHADAVRDFRNYIHPRQQVRENFSPRMFTARMAHQVLLATIADLGRLR